MRGKGLGPLPWLESLSNVAVAKVCWWIALSSQDAGDTALQCTVRYLSPRYKCTAAGERAESCAGGGWWRCWVPSKNRWTGALPPPCACLHVHTVHSRGHQHPSRRREMCQHGAQQSMVLTYFRRVETELTLSLVIR